jgi:hypothetical protein
MRDVVRGRNETCSRRERQSAHGRIRRGFSERNLNNKVGFSKIFPDWEIAHPPRAQWTWTDSARQMPLGSELSCVSRLRIARALANQTLESLPTLRQVATSAEQSHRATQHQKRPQGRNPVGHLPRARAGVPFPEGASQYPPRIPVGRAGRGHCAHRHSQRRSTACESVVGRNATRRR